MVQKEKPDPVKTFKTESRGIMFEWHYIGGPFRRSNPLKYEKYLMIENQYGVKESISWDIKAKAEEWQLEAIIKEAGIAEYIKEGYDGRLITNATKIALQLIEHGSTINEIINTLIYYANGFRDMSDIINKTVS
jgi:hypothetical protein